MTREIIICRGTQASGKTSYARNWVLEDPEHRVRISNDDIRNMLGKYWVPSREDLVSRIKECSVIGAIVEGFNIIIDNMNLNPKEIKYWQRIIEFVNTGKDYKYSYTLHIKDFFAPLEECIRRDSLRSNPVGEEVIKNTFEKYKDIISNIEKSCSNNV